MFAYLKAGDPIVIINVVFWFLAIPLAYGLFKVRAWAWYYFLFHSLSMIILGFFRTGFRFDFSPIVFLNLLFLIPIGYFISKEIRAVYFNPRLRWWEQSKRFLHEVKVEIEGNSYRTFDLSETGAFIIDTKELNLEPNEIFPIVLDVDKNRIISFAEVRWINNEKNRYPVGYGIKFDKISIKDKKIIRDFLKMLENEGNKEHK